MTYPEDVKLMEEQWSRRIAVYSEVGEDVICSVWAEEALTGWLLYNGSPVIQEFNGEKCLTIPLASWIMVKHLGDETATPFRIVSKGHNLIQRGYLPHIGLKNPVRQGADDRVNVLIPLSDFNKVQATEEDQPYHGKERKKRRTRSSCTSSS